MITLTCQLSNAKKPTLLLVSTIKISLINSTCLTLMKLVPCTALTCQQLVTRLASREILTSTLTAKTFHSSQPHVQ